MTPPSKTPAVQTFLEDIELADGEKYQILQGLRSVVFEVLPNVQERIMYGGIMFTHQEDWGGLFVSKHHVSFEFSKGFLLKDPQKVLEGTGKFRRHLKIKTMEDIAEKDVESFVRQII